jgi:hypothetical protein
MLFGSRTDDKRRGGDIDLLFETNQHLTHRTQTLNALCVALVGRVG